MSVESLEEDKKTLNMHLLFLWLSLNKLHVPLEKNGLYTDGSQEMHGSFERNA